jgi:hypothetical protein
MPHAVGLAAAWAVTLRARMAWWVKLLFGGLFSVGLAVAALTAPLPTAIWMGFWATVVVIVAPVWSFLRRDWAGTALSIVALVATSLLVGWLYVGLRGAQRWGRVFYTLHSFPGAVSEFREKRGHVPQAVEDLVQAGVMGGDPAFLKTFFLAPLDDRFFERDSWASVSPDFLCAYRVQGYEDAPGAWLVVNMLYGTYPEAPREVVQWVTDQREAITWLEESFPLPELERLAASDGRRARMASVVLDHRRAKQVKQGSPKDTGR